MSGAAIMLALFSQEPAIVAIVSKDGMYPGEIAQEAVLPCLGFEEISERQENMLGGREAKVLRTERVQVTVACRSYAARRTLYELIRMYRHARADVSTYEDGNSTPSATFEAVTVMPDTGGPAFEIPEKSIYLRSKDFIVTYLVNAT